MRCDNPRVVSENLEMHDSKGNPLCKEIIHFSSKIKTKECTLPSDMITFFMSVRPRHNDLHPNICTFGSVMDT